MSTPTIVFDLDGTLIDTAPDLVEALNVILAREGLPALIYDAARNLIGGGAKAMIARGLEAEGRAYSPAKLEELFADFIAHYSDHLTEQSRPFPGVIDALDALSEHGYQFAVCTNKLECLSVKILEHLGLAKRFVAVCGPDTFGIEKPDPEFLRRTVATAGGTLERAIVMGASIVDIRTARAAGIPIIAVDFGYTSTDEPPRLRPNPVVVDLTQGAPSTAKKPAKPAAKKPTRPKAAAAPAPAPMMAAPAPTPSSPWPTFRRLFVNNLSTSLARRGSQERARILDAMANIGQNSYILGCEPGTRCAGNGWQ
jgi:phosphoglycolate phosphatase